MEEKEKRFCRDYKLRKSKPIETCRALSKAFDDAEGYLSSIEKEVKEKIDDFNEGNKSGWIIKCDVDEFALLTVTIPSTKRNAAEIESPEFSPASKFVKVKRPNDVDVELLVDFLRKLSNEFDIRIRLVEKTYNYFSQFDHRPLGFSYVIKPKYYKFYKPTRGSKKGEVSTFS